MDRNKYLGTESYIVFIDMMKCFDKLWLEDCVLELWRAGMNPLDARIIYELNKKARAIIETPCGVTDEIPLNRVAKQGTVYEYNLGVDHGTNKWYRGKINNQNGA